MQINYQLPLTLVLMSLIYSFFYFYIYSQNKHKYIAIWGFGWMVYSLGYLIDIFIWIGPYSSILINILSIISSFILLVGTFEFIGSKLYTLVRNISVLLSLFTLFFNWILYAVGGEIYLSDYLALPASILLCVISVGTGILFLVHEDNNRDSLFRSGNRDIITDITAWFFIIWGTHKGFYNFVTPDYYSSAWNYISSIFLTNILNITLILTYSAENNSVIKSRERLYRLLTENAKDIILKIKLHPKVEYTYISPAIVTITGYVENDFYKNPNFFSNVIEKEDRERYLEYIRTVKDIDSKITFRFIRKDQKIIWLEQHSTLVNDERESIVYLEAILRDISDRRLIEENLFKSETARRQLLANISHELKSPITSIIGYLSIIEDNITASPKQYMEYVKTCLEKSLTLNELIQDLFELSKLEANQLAFHFEKLHAGEYLQEAYNKIKVDIEKNGVSCKWNGNWKYLDNLFILIDKRRIDQILHNIITNALNHIGENGIITFNLNCDGVIKYSKVQENRDAYVLIAIEDNGVGITAAEIPLIFQRFYRSQSSGLNGGTGLGLAISKEIIDIHKGHIWAESEVNKGTTIYIALPKLINQKLLI